MSQDHTLMASRFELKYHVTEQVALQVRNFVQQHLELDEFGEGKPQNSYPVHSLYLDSDDWRIYQATLNGDKNRFKLRLRFYDDNPKTPVYFEIKRRRDNIILKKRASVPRQYIADALHGQLPPMAAVKNSEELFALQDFLRLMLQTNAKPKLHIAYDREAYVSEHNNEVRLTFDRNVRWVTRYDGRVTEKMENPIFCTRDLVVLELKFTGRFPNWYRELVEAFNCFQVGAAKYMESAQMLKGQGLHPRDVVRNLVF